MMVERCLDRPTRAVCIREVQKSLEQSSKLVIEDKIRTLGVGHYFRVMDKEIRSHKGGLIIFQGMQNHNAESIKSLEGYDIAWVEEAQALSQRSLRMLTPTMRKAGAEMWFSWNPESADDPVDQMLRGEKRIRSAAVVQANWKDNPWFPESLREEMRSDAERGVDDFDHVWNGGYLTITAAVIFRNRVSVELFETPEDVDRFYFGADWGFANDPTALIRGWIRDDVLYIDHEAFGYQTELDDIPALFDRVPGARDWPIKGDNSRPETISYVGRQGFNIAAAEKWPGSVEDGIAQLKGFKRIVVHERCSNIAKEFRLYSFKTDRITGDVMPIIVDKFNHGIDAIRYSLDGYIQQKGEIGVWLRAYG